MVRRSVLGSCVVALACWTAWVTAQSKEGISPQSVTIGMSAAFTGASRSLGIELYRGSMAYLTEINRRGGVHGRQIRIQTYDDGYQPDAAGSSRHQTP